jgi:hypothetical protein
VKTRNWSRTRLRGFAALTIGGTAVISFSSVQHLAYVNGFGWLSWLYPLCLDAVAAFGMDVWIRRSPAWKAAAWLALFAILCSLLANGWDHGSNGWLAAVLGALPPFMLACLLGVLHKHGAIPPPDERDRVPETVSAPENNGQGRKTPVAPSTGWPFAPPETASERTQIIPAYRPEPPKVRPDLDAERTQVFAPVKAPKVSSPLRRTPPKRAPRPAGTKRAGRTDAEIIADLGETVDQITKRRLMDTYGVGSTRALRIMKEARDGQG